MFSFAMLPAIGFLSTLAILPVVAVRFGAHGWPAIALGTSIGSAAGVVAELGWGINGPAHVARARPRARSQLYMLSLVTQVSAAVPISVIAAIGAATISQHFRLESALMAFASCWMAISPSWFFVGTGQPRYILLTATLPEVLASFASAAAIWFGASLWLYPVAQFAVTVFGLVMGIRLTRGRFAHVRNFGLRRLLRIVRIQWVGLQGNIASSLYIMLPIAIVGVLSPSSLGTFSTAERMQRMLLGFLGSIPQSFQNWVGSAGSAIGRRSRAVSSVKINAGIGAFFALVFALLAPLGSKILFADRFTIGFDLSFLCAVVILCTQTSRASGRIALVVYRRINVLRTSAIIGAVIGVLSLIAGAKLLGAHGALAAEGLAEIVVLSVQLVGLRRAIKLRGDRHAERRTGNSLAER